MARINISRAVDGQGLGFAEVSADGTVIANRPEVAQMVASEIRRRGLTELDGWSNGYLRFDLVAEPTNSRSAIFWEEKKHPRNPDGKFGKGHADIPGPIFDFGGAEDIDLNEPPAASGPIFSFEDDDLGSPPKPKLPVKGKKAMGTRPKPEASFDEPPDDFDLGPAPSVDEPPADVEPPPELPEVARPGPTQGRAAVARMNQEQGAKEYTELPSWFESDRMEKLEGNYTWWENLPPANQQAVRDLVADTSRKPTYVRMYPGGLDGMARDGRIKNIHEVRNKGEDYTQQRRDYEREVMGLDADTPDENLPVYGYIGDKDVADGYGFIVAKMRPETRDRTSATVGDSLNGFAQPFGVDKMPELTDSQLLASIYGATNTRSYLEQGSIFDYLEAQIHGGVHLRDIESVTIEVPDGATLDEVASPQTLAALRAHGVEVVVEMPDLLPGLTPDQIAKLKGAS